MASLTPNQAYCKDALQIQDACNPVAVVNCLARHLSGRLLTEGTDSVCQSAPFALFIDKLADMAGRPDFNRYRSASAECHRTANNIADARQGGDV